MNFCIATFNICSSHFLHGHYTDENLARLATHIRACGADMICLQEVDRGCLRSNGVDMPQALGKAAGYPYQHFIRIRPFQGGEYGTAILSRIPFDACGVIDYPVQIATQGTSCGYVRIQNFLLFNTHLSVESDDANTETMQCLGEILGRVSMPFVCCGDFNAGPDKLEHILPDFLCANHTVLTYADRSIDNMLYRAPVCVKDVCVRDTTSDSVTDHNMLLAQICM